MESTAANDTKKSSGSKIPAPSNFRRSASVRLRGEKANFVSTPVGGSTPFPSIAEREEFGYVQDKKYWNQRKLTFGNLNRSRSQASGLNKHRDEDLESVDSFASGASNISTSTCEHAHFARNGTTFSGRNFKYVVHCSAHGTTPEEYLTPTQRANKSIRRLKTLLQLAKEKLIEKEHEIFKLTKEVVELKVFKASLINSHFSTASTPSEVKDISACLQEKSIDALATSKLFNSNELESQNVKDFPCDTYNELSPIKTSYYLEDKIFEDKGDEDIAKLSPTSPQHCFDKISATPDFLLSSLADSGNFDDLASSVSVQSKDSIGFSITPELRPLPEERQMNESYETQINFSLDVGDGTNARDREEERSCIVNMYENKLKEQKEEYEAELKRILSEQEDRNLQTMDHFEDKLKEEEKKFEERWKNLLRSSEEEKIKIVDRFETRLEEEKIKYMEKYMDVKMGGGKISDLVLGDSYVKTVEEEKVVYEVALGEIKARFEGEKKMMEEKFDQAVAEERKRFELSVEDIQKSGQEQIQALLTKLSDLEARYTELVPKYDAAVSHSAALELENSALRKAAEEVEEKNRNMYLKMYLKGQEAARLEHADNVAEFASQAPDRVSVPEMLVQLKVTEAELDNLKAMYRRLAEAQSRPLPPRERPDNDPEATLQFLKSAVYYFLTDHDNHLGHLRAIESILGFSAAERSHIDKVYVHK